MLTVNSNIASINAQRNLYKANNALGKSLERLSSGLRINRAGDDAAGLAISEGLRSQIRGLNQAVRNANDGVSVVGTAEGAIDEVTSILQRIRELAVQASNDTNSATNRASLQAEIDQNLEELTRIANTVEFNGLKLLDGTFNDKKLQVGAMQNQTISISIGDMRSSALGAVATVQSGQVVQALSSGDLNISGVDIGASQDDEISYYGQDSSAISIAAAINEKSSETGVTAEVDGTTIVADTTPEDPTDSVSTGISAITLDGDASSGDSLTINGVNIGAVAVSDNDGDDALVDAINAKSNQTGVKASTNSNGQLVLEAEDGRNITIKTTGSDTAVNLGLADAAGDVLDGSDATEANGTFHGTVTLRSTQAFSLQGSNSSYAGLTDGSVSIDTSTAISFVDVTTASGAADTIRTVDFAMKRVSEVRSGLGAITNRLESTIRNLQAVSENLQASDSRIRDADFAAETATLVRNQILQQAGLSVLAQANVLPQSALSLLG